MAILLARATKLRTLCFEHGSDGKGDCQLLSTGVAVEIVRDRNVYLAAIIAAAEFFFCQLSGSSDSGGCWLAEEPHQSLEVLGRRCEEELLPNELNPA